MDHIRRGLATAGILAGLALPQAAVAQALPQLAAPQAEAPGGFTQRGVVAEATAEDAVAARERGMIAAQRAAWTRLAAEMNLPPASDRQIESMVDSMVVEQERTTLTTYSGRLTVNFNPGRVQGFAARRMSAPEQAQGQGPASAPAPAPAPMDGPQIPATYLEVTARYGSLAEWLDLRRRLLSSTSVTQVDVLAMSVDQARLRLGLRAPAAQVASEMAPAGLRLLPGARAGEGWRVGLAGRT